MKEPKPQIPADAPEGTVWFGGPIDRCTITLRIYGDDLMPEEITRLLNCPPSHSQTRGCPIHGKDGTFRRLAKSGGWHLTLTSEEAGEWDVEQVILQLLARLPSEQSIWHTLSRKYRVDLFCGLFMETRNRGFSLSAETCRELADRSIEIGFDVYGPD